MVSTLKFIAIIFLLSACSSADLGDPRSAQNDGPSEAQTGKADTVHGGEFCKITLCLTGAMDHRTPSNDAFRVLCEDPRLDGLVYDCQNDRCNQTFDSFLQFPLLTVYPALTEAIDRNKDGVIDDNDPICEVNLIGFSWGGVNALSIAHHLRQDRQVPNGHKTIAKAVLLDAFQPFSSGRMVVPDNVRSVRSFRHSIASADDCSRHSPLGPYLGYAPVCSTEQDCADYDYSLFPDDVFYDRYDTPHLGRDIGHCMVPAVAHEQIISYLSEATPDAANGAVN